jgi:cell division protein FtsB
MPKTQFSHRSHIAPKTVLLFLVSAIVFFSMLYAVGSIGRKYIESHRELRESQAQEQELMQKKQNLAQENAYLATPEGQEQTIREKYSLVKPGEEMIVITQPSSDTAVGAAPHSAVGRWWDKLLRVLGIRHTQKQ